MKKVTSIVLNNFTNDSRVLKEAISLQKAGYDVTVVALHEVPLLEFETISNIAVNRIKLKSKNWSKKRVVQIIKYLEFLYKTVIQYKESDVLHCNDLGTLPIGVIVKKLYNKDIKIVYDAHEYETETHYTKGFRKIMVKVMERVLIKYVDKTITVSSKIADEYVRLYNIERPSLVLNTPLLQEVKKKDLFRERFNIPKSSKIFLYQGALNRGRGIEMILDAFSSLEAKQIVVFMGYGILEGEIKKYSQKYPNIFLHEAVSPEKLLSYTSSADFGISLIEDSCLSYRYCLPNKMFEYIMVGLPVIVSNLPEMVKIIEANYIGVVSKEYSTKGLKEAIRATDQLNSEKVKKEIQKVKKIYNWQAQEKILLEVYNAL